jgi:two-component system NtrC family sensor kinase
VDGGRETILLVEDNSDVREVARSSLKHYGYRVIEAANGTEAIKVFKKLEGRIDLLFTDVVMPAMGGQTLAESLRIQKPGLPVLFMSGHPFEINTKKLAAMDGNDFIQKPFKPLELAQKIRRMLDGTEGTP